MKYNFAFKELFIINLFLYCERFKLFYLNSESRILFNRVRGVMTVINLDSETIITEIARS